MIPISLTLKGIYSYQDKEQTIKFNHLTDAGIFGIFGSVGSGKSTILEALSYALYGETERLNRRENRGYNMMNLKSSNLLIDFIFQGGDQNSEYRFMVKGRRNSKNFTDVKAFNREAFKKQNNQWIPISADSTEEIIGLNYLNFRRTVIIPQGKFQEFLQLGDADRTKMMKELFHLERFDLSFKVRAKELENDEKISFLEGELNQLVDIVAEKLIETNTQIEKLEVLLKQNKIELEGVQKQNEDFNKTQELFTRIKHANKHYNDIRINSRKYELLDNELREYNYCILNFKSLIENKKRAKNQNTELTTELQTLHNRFTKLKKQIANEKETLKQLKPKFDSREKLKTQAEELEKLLKVTEIESTCAKLSGRIKNGEQTSQNTLLKIEQLSKNKIEFQNSIKETRTKLPDLGILSKIKDWYTNNNHLRNEQASIKKEKEENTKIIKGYKNELNVLTVKILPSLDSLDENLIAKAIEQTTQEVEYKFTEIDNQIKDFQIRKSLSEYAQNLHDGDSCPVCGSNSHPDKLEEKDISGKIKALNNQKAVLKNEMQSLTDFEKKTAEYRFKIDSLNELLEKQEQKSLEIEQKIEVQQKTYPAKEKIKESVVDNKFEQARLLQEKLEKYETELFDLEKSYEKELADKEKFENALNQFKRDLSSEHAKKETLSAQITNVDIQIWQSIGKSKIEEEIKDLLKQYNQLTLDFKYIERSLNNSRTEYSKYEGIIQTKETDLKLNKQELENISIKLENGISKSDFQDENQIENILKKDLDIEKTAKEIDEFNQKLFSLKEQLRNLQEQAKGKEYDAQKHEQITIKLNELKAVAEKQGKELGSLEKDKKTLTKKLNEKQRLEKEHRKLKLRADNIASLKSLFKGSGFVNYVSSVYLQNLINAANERFFRLTNQKLQLELTEDNNFEIRDFLNEGKTRSVKTLSGGQTFQASLSLALALADNIQSLTHSGHNFFFLDEGFGSLDRESLSVVFSSLKTLRKENRIVGVISHVEDLQQEVETYLKIENNQEKGSLITKSWE